MNQGSCVGLILAGGKSSRMGQDKAQLKQINHKSNLQNCVNLLIKSGVSKVVISGNYQKNLQQLLSNTKITGNSLITDEGVEIISVSDRKPNLGPLSGIETVIHKMQPKKLIVIPIDMPLLTARLIKRLLKAIPENEVVYFKGHYLPLGININKNVKMHIRTVFSHPNRNQHSIKNFIGMMKLKILTVSANVEPMLDNFNTSEQWQRYLNKE